MGPLWGKVVLTLLPSARIASIRSPRSPLVMVICIASPEFQPLYIEPMNAQKTGPVAAEMLCRLNSALSPEAIELTDDSEQHRGHGGYNPAGESHFSLRIESASFAGKSRVERQRMVYAALGDLMESRVHALSIRGTAPGEWQGPQSRPGPSRRVRR